MRTSLTQPAVLTLDIFCEAAMGTLLYVVLPCTAVGRCCRRRTGGLSVSQRGKGGWVSIQCFCLGLRE